MLRHLEYIIASVKQTVYILVPNNFVVVVLQNRAYFFLFFLLDFSRYLWREDSIKYQSLEFY